MFDEMFVAKFFVLALAVWRMASLLANETGPFYIFLHLRRTAVRLERRSRILRAFHLTEGINCEWCNSMWFAIPVTAGWLFLGDMLIITVMPFALSSITIVIKYIVQNLEMALSLKEKRAKILDEQSIFATEMRDEVMSNN